MLSYVAWDTLFRFCAKNIMYYSFIVLGAHVTELENKVEVLVDDEHVQQLRACSINKTDITVNVLTCVQFCKLSYSLCVDKRCFSLFVGFDGDPH